MGKPDAGPSDQISISHFSHPHPLKLSDLQTLGQIMHCSACKLDATGSVYTCTSCNFVLHPKCLQLPQQIEHPFDQNHALALQPKPVYPEGLFICDACGNQGSGFSYHCSPCGVDLHTTCASLPMEFTHERHQHQLSLTFSAPYPGNMFSCDICRRIGSKTWVYRCSTCEFDVHLTCVATLIPRALIRQITTTRSIFSPQPSNLINPPNMGGYGAPSPQPVVFGQAQNQFAANSYPAGVPHNDLNQPTYGAAARPANGGGLRDQLMVGAVNGIGSGVAQSTTQALLQGIFGGGVDDVSHVDVIMGTRSGGVTMDGGSYCDGGHGGVDGGNSGGGGSF